MKIKDPCDSRQMDMQACPLGSLPAEIRTERLLLSPLGPQYVKSAFVYSGDLENTKFMLDLPEESIEETQEFLKKAEAEWQKEFPEFYEFAILTEGAHIGSVCLYLNEDRTEGELGWILNKRYWGHGYTFEAAQALIDYAFQNLGIKKFIAYCDSENIPSYSLMEKLGMSRVLCRSGRKNRSSSEERMEYKYALTIE